MGSLSSGPREQYKQRVFREGRSAQRCRTDGWRGRWSGGRGGGAAVVQAGPPSAAPLPSGTLRGTVLRLRVYSEHPQGPLISASLMGRLLAASRTVRLSSASGRGGVGGVRRGSCVGLSCFPHLLSGMNLFSYRDRAARWLRRSRCPFPSDPAGPRLLAARGNLQTPLSRAERFLPSRWGWGTGRWGVSCMRRPCPGLHLPAAPNLAPVTVTAGEWGALGL